MPMNMKFYLIAKENGFISPFTGGYVRGFFLNTVRKELPELSEYLHDAKTVKPYAVKPLRPMKKKMEIVNKGWKIKEGDEVIFDLSILDESIEDDVMQLFIGINTYSFGQVKFEFNKMEITKKPYKDLAKELFSSRIGITFHTPTLFNIKGRKITYLFPDPIRIIGNLLTIWNKFAPQKLKIPSNIVIEWVSDAIETKSYELKTREVAIERIKITGFKGRVEWIILEDEKELLTYISPLLKLSEFSNVGEKRTYGLGTVSVKNIQ